MTASETFDYVVAGGGTAGCVLAARLSEDASCRVLLLEAGGSGTTFFHRMPAANGFLFGRPRFDWNFASLPQAGLRGRRLSYPRGRGLGGSSAMNGMIYIRGNAADYDLWRQSGLEGWGFADLLPYFRRAEGSWRGDGPWHGGGGPLKTVRARQCGAMERAFLAACHARGLAASDDFNGPSQQGAGLVDVTVHRGRRQSTAQSYLAAALPRPNLTVRRGARVLGLVMAGRRARALRYRRGGVEALAAARGEIVLALGAFGTPQLLMLSGIGPAAHLRSHGIAAVAHLPGVGRNLQDHPDVFVQHRCLRPRLSLARYQRPGPALALLAAWLLTGRGPGAAPFWGAVAFAPRRAGSARPDFQLFLTPMVLLPGDGTAWNPLRLPFVRGRQALAGFQIDVNLLRPQSRGRLALASPDPAAAPAIDPAFLAAEDDRRAMVEAVIMARELVADAAFDGLRGPELAPGPQVEGEEALLDYVRATATTGHHPVGTCRMGGDGDPMAVTGADLKVRGIEGLRVADASVMPDIVTGNTAAIVVAIAEKAADLLRGRPPPPPADLATLRR